MPGTNVIYTDLTIKQLILIIIYVKITLALVHSNNMWYSSPILQNHLCLSTFGIFHLIWVVVFFLFKRITIVIFLNFEMLIKVNIYIA